LSGVRPLPGPVAQDRHAADELRRVLDAGARLRDAARQIAPQDPVLLVGLERHPLGARPQLADQREPVLRVDERIASEVEGS
jgi:hypothetical protein